MIEKECGELRRRLKKERTTINHIYGCYVSETKQIISTFDQPMLELSEDEQEKYLGLLKKVISGSMGRQLSDISFATKQVVDSDEHRLLSALRTSGAGDEQSRMKLYEKIIGSVSFETNYLILLAGDAYDVPFRSKDGAMQADAGEETYSYVLCSVCPVKLTKPTLHYDAEAGQFHNRGVDWVVSPPELGFLFPAFDDRRTNLYGALYYCRDASAGYDDFVDAVFHTPAPMPPKTQRDTFSQVLTTSLEEDCCYAVIQSVHEQMAGLIAAHKQSKEPQPLVINRSTVDGMLKQSGVAEERIEAFHEQFDDAFGADSVLPPKNLVDDKHFELRTPDVVIKVNPERQDLVQTRMVNGTKYIMIEAGAGIELNGINLQWAGEGEKAEN